MQTYTVKEGVWVAGVWREAGETFEAAPKVAKYLVLAGQVERVALKAPPKKAPKSPAPSPGEG